MSYAPDPGGVFASDTHRRVLGHLHDEPQELNALGYRVSDDANHGLETVAELAEVLQDLEADGHAKSTDAGWKLTKNGLDALQAPLPNEPSGPVKPALLAGLETGGRGGARG